MSEKEYLIDFDLGTNGGALRLLNVERAQEWLRAEKNHWEWLLEMDDGGEIAHAPTFTFGHYRTLEQCLNRFAGEQLSIQQLRNEFRNRLMGNPPVLLHSSGDLGQAVLAIKEEQGATEAALAFALITGEAKPSGHDVRQQRLLTLVALPHLITKEGRMAAARASYRAIISESQEVLEHQKDLLTASKQDFDERIRTGSERLASIIRKRVRAYVKAQTRRRHTFQSAINSLKSTEQTYTEHMHLRASVEYWEQKASAHSKEEGAQKEAILNFVAKSLLGLGVAFVLAFLVMLEMSGVNSLPWIDLTPEGAATLPATPFLVVTVFLGSILTAFFWAARILVRNYVTERHLKIDAEERRVMTMTYLALINEQAAVADEDRLVILNALFRPSGDGIRHDDGPQEVALPALMAKLIDQRPQR